MKITKENLIRYFKSRIIDFDNISFKYDYFKRTFSINPEEDYELSVFVLDFNDSYQIFSNIGEKFELSYEEFNDLRKIFFKYDKILSQKRNFNKIINQHVIIKKEEEEDILKNP